VTTFDDRRLAPLSGEQGLHDTGMQIALLAALEDGEVAKALYSVSAHVWVAAILTDRALLLVKGAVRARVTRVPFPLDVIRGPRASKKGVRLRTSLGVKTLWGSKLDPDMAHLLACASTTGASGAATPRETSEAAPVGTSEVNSASGSTEAMARQGDSGPAPTARPTRRERAEARRRAGKKPRKPKLQKARRAWVGLPPGSTAWDISHNCVKCGRALTNPNSQRHRVGTDCIKRYGSQARKITNPAYTEWSARKARADVDRIAQQVVYDAEFARASAAHAKALETWRAVRSGRDARHSGPVVDPRTGSLQCR
jgi:hypothetical protein